MTLTHIIQAIKQIPVNEDTCVFEYQAKTNLIPDCEHGLNCPYSNKDECEGYKRLGLTEQRFSHLRLYR